MSENRTIEEMFYGSVTVGERGQVVIPAEARSAQGIASGDKLLVFGHPSRGGVQMVKMSGVAEFVEGMKAALALAETQSSETDDSDGET